jgi:hypothetical protein
MRIFISYAREDQAAVEVLNADLERARVQVWMDEELIGGESWWDTILEQIRSCELYIFALSPNSVGSRACQAELDYAIALSRPLLPVLVEEVALQLAHPAIARTQMVDYRKRSMESLLALMAVVANRPPAPPLPDPLPAAPTTPMSYMNEFRELVDAPDLTYQKQAHLLLDLKGYLDRDEERDIALQLVRGLRQRRDISYSIAREIDQLLKVANGEDRSPTGKAAGAAQDQFRSGPEATLTATPSVDVEDRDWGPEWRQSRWLASPQGSRSLLRRRRRLKRPTSHCPGRQWLASRGGRSRHRRMHRQKAGVRQPLQHGPRARRAPRAAAAGALRRSLRRLLRLS